MREYMEERTVERSQARCPQRTTLRVALTVTRSSWPFPGRDTRPAASSIASSLNSIRVSARLLLRGTPVKTPDRGRSEEDEGAGGEPQHQVGYASSKQTPLYFTTQARVPFASERCRKQDRDGKSFQAQQQKRFTVIAGPGSRSTKKAGSNTPPKNRRDVPGNEVFVLPCYK